MDDSFRQHELVLDLAPHLLTISLLDCEALDVMFGFDFNFEGNHDEVVSEALGVGHGLEGLFELPRAQVINYEPSMTLASERVVSASVPAGDRDPDQRVSRSGPASSATTRSASTSRCANTGEPART